MENNKVLIVDEEHDFGVLMQFYLSKKGADVKISNEFIGALDTIESERPDVIVIDKNIAPNVEDTLDGKVNSIENYAPKIFYISS